MDSLSFPLITSFGLILEAKPSDTDGLLGMVERMAAHHGDISSLSADILARDVFSDRPWIYVLVAEADDLLIGHES